MTVLAAALFMFGRAVMAVAAPAPAQLSITLSDGQSAVHPHSMDEYTITLVNGGSHEAAGTLTFAAPAYADYQRASSHGKVTSGTIRWKITVGAGASRTEQVTVRLRTIPKSAVRVTTLASFNIGAVTSTPLIRTADADRIPGRADPAPAAPLSPLTPVQHRATTEHNDRDWVLITAAAALLFAGLVLALRQFRRAQRRGGTPTGPASEVGDRDSHAGLDGFAAVGLGGDADP